MPRGPRKHNHKIENLPPERLAEIISLLLAGFTPHAVRDRINARWEREGYPVRITQEDPIWALRIAFLRGEIIHVPPLGHTLADRIRTEYKVNEQRSLHVVSTRDDHREIAGYVARCLKQRILALGETRNVVHVGFAAGATATGVAESLAALLRDGEPFPKLVLYDLSTSFDADRPTTATRGRFRAFEVFGKRVECRYLSCVAVVKSNRDHQRLREDPLLAKRFEEVKRLDVVVTALASASHEHGDLNELLAGHPEVAQRLRPLGWLADIMGLPYGMDGPIVADVGLRAVTLLELADLIALASQKEKYVFVVAGRCFATNCPATREEALRPLLTSPKVALWTDLFMDLSTAEKLLDAATPARADGASSSYRASSRAAPARVSSASASAPSSG